MICSGDNVAFGAPCLVGAGEGDGGIGDSAGVAVTEGDSNGCGVNFFFRRSDVPGEGVGVGVAVGVSLGLGVGEAFFLRRGDPGGFGVGDSVSAAGVRFFFGDKLGDVVGDSSSFGAGECFFFGDEAGEGVGVGDFFFAEVAVAFFFRCGVGVGVAKILLRVWPRDGSAASFTEAATMRHASKIKIRRSMVNYLDGDS